MVVYLEMEVWPWDPPSYQPTREIEVSERGGVGVKVCADHDNEGWNDNYDGNFDDYDDKNYQKIQANIMICY